MSGQYKIRSNSKDDFSDIAGGARQAKSGCSMLFEGCGKLIALLILMTICAAIFVGTTSAQGTRYSRGRCFPHKTLYTTAPVEVRNDDSRFARQVMQTVPGKTYTVTMSKKDSIFNSCWVRIREGWMLRRPTGSVIKPGSPTQQTAITTTSDSATSATSSRCYTSSKAYITGAMNIRSGPGTSNRKVGSAQAGESFTVSQSRRNGDYCWLKVNKGWIVKTGRVSSSKPVARSTTGPASSTTPCPMPPVHGSAELKGAVHRAADVLGRHPNWCNYVTSARPASFAELTYGGCAQLDSSERQFKLYLSRSLCRSNDAYVTASFIVHEACHLHQLNAGSRLTNPRVDEPPCYQKQIDFLINVAPGRYGDVVSQFRDKIRQYRASVISFALLEVT